MPTTTIIHTPIKPWADQRLLNYSKAIAVWLLHRAGITHGGVEATLPELGTTDPLVIDVRSATGGDPAQVVTAAALRSEYLRQKAAQDAAEQASKTEAASVDADDDGTFDATWNDVKSAIDEVAAATTASQFARRWAIYERRKLAAMRKRGAI